MIIGGLQKVTLIDYPGRVAATIFLCGCNFRCPWCYSPELVLPEKINPHTRTRIPTNLKGLASSDPPKAGRISSFGVGAEKDFFQFLKKRKGLLEGVVICGGEPTIHKDLPKFAEKIKKMGYSVKLDTNGSNPKMLKDLIDKKLIDYVAVDIKAPLGAKVQSSPPEAGPPLAEKFKVQSYDKTTGVKVDLEKIKKSIEIIKDSGIEYEFRTTVVPTIHTKEVILQIAKDIAPAKRYYLQNFRPEKTIDPKFEKIKPYSKEFLLEIKKEISFLFDTCEVR